MVQSCCVPKCKNRQRRGNNISFFTFPKNDVAKTNEWLAAVNLTHNYLIKNKDPRICSQHFRPFDFIFGGNVKKLKKTAVPRNVADVSNKENINAVDEVEFEAASTTIDDSNRAIKLLENKNAENERTVLIECTTNNQNSVKEQQLYEEIFSLRQEVLEKAKKIESLHAQLAVFQKEISYLKHENQMLKEKQQHNERPLFTLQKFENNDKKILYYTGFETYAIMKAVYNYVLPSEGNNVLNIYENDSGNSRPKSLSQQNQFFLTMIRLRRGLCYETLGDMFNVSKATTGKICLCWINLMYVRLGALNIWPSRDILIQNAPLEVQEKYGNVVGSIDCTEFYIERPTSLVKQSECYSHYKSTTTLKSLLMTDPNGGIIYMSPLFTGSISDKNIIVQSGFLDILRNKVETKDIHPQDVILADKGFNVASLFEEIHLNINIPTFRISGTQFTEEEVQWIREVAHERIHVERAIGRLKQYRIFAKKIPVSLLGTIEQIYTICCILTNFRKKLR